MTTEVTGLSLGMDSSQLEQGAQKAAQALDNVGKKAIDAQRNLDATAQKASAAGQHFAKAGELISGAVKGLVAVAAATMTIEKMVKEAVAFEQQSVRMEAQMRRLGSEAESTKARMNDFADALSRVSGFDDDAIRGAEIALRELGVRSQGTVEGITELSVAIAGLRPELGGAEEVSRMLAKALEHPAEASRTLRQLNIGLTESTTQQIEAMAKSGKTAEASALMYKAVGEAIGGTDKAISASLNTIEGRARQLETTWGNLLEGVSHSKPFNDLSQIILVGLTKTIIGAKYYLGEFLAMIERVVYFAEAHNPMGTADSRASAQGLLNQANSETLNRLAEYQKELADVATGGAAAGEGQRKAALGAKDFAGFAKNAAAAAGEQTDKLGKLTLGLNLEIEEYQKLTAALKNGLPYHDRLKATLDAEKKARAEGIDLHTKEGQLYVQKALLLGNVKGAYEELKQQISDANDKQKQFFDDLQSNATDNIVNALTGEQTFGKMVENITGNFKKALIKMQVEALLNPIMLDVRAAISGGGGIGSVSGGGGSGFGLSGLSNLFGGSSSLGITAGVADPEFGYMGQLGPKGVDGIANGGFFSGLFNSDKLFGGSVFGAGGTSLGTVFGNSGYGFIGSTAANLFGLSGNGMGSNIGGTAGSLIGSAVGGPVGAVAGSFLGSIFGGLFDDDGRAERDKQQAALSNQRDQYVRTEIANFLKLGTATTQTGQQIAQLTAQFDGLKAKAKELGVSTDLLDNQFATLKKKITTDFNDGIAAAIAALEDDPKAALEQLKKAQEQRILEAIDAEGDLAQVRKLNALELQKFYDNLTTKQLQALDGMAAAVDLIKSKLKDLTDSIKSAISDQLSTVRSYASEQDALEKSYRNISAALKSAITGLRGGSLSTLSPLDILNEQRKQFQDTYAKAMTGDQSALGNLSSFAQVFLQSSKGYNASSEAYASDFNMVQAALEKSGAASGSYGDLAKRQADLAQAQVRILEQIRDNMGQETPDTALLKQQLSALNVLAGLTKDGNVTGLDQVEQITQGNTIQEAINRLIAQDSSTSNSILDALAGANAGQVVLVQKIVEGNVGLANMLGSYFQFQKDLAEAEAKRKAQEAAAAARQAQIDARLSTVRGLGNNIKNAMNAVEDTESTGNQHSWAVYFNAAANKFDSSMSADKGDPTWDRPRAEAATSAIMSAMNAVIKEIGITSLPQSMAYIARKYGSSLTVGGQTFNTSLNDYEGMASFGILQAIKQGAGGNQALKEYALGLNWFDLAGSLSALEKKAIDLGLRGFATGGSFMVGGKTGVDANVVAFRATQNERVTITTPQQEANQNGSVVQSIMYQTGILADSLAAVQEEVRSLAKQISFDREMRKRAV